MNEKRDNSGALFRNTYKKEDKHPDYTGSATVDGADYKLAAWLRESRDGHKFMALAFTLKEEAAAPKSAPKPNHTNGNEEAPF